MITGRQALKVFYDEAQLYDGGAELPYSFEGFLALLKKSPDKGHRFLEATLDNAITAMADDSFFGIDGDVRDAMAELADISDGALPHSNAFVMALSNEFSNIPTPIVSYFDIIEKASDTTTAVTKDLANSITNISSDIKWLTGKTKYIVLSVGAIALYMTMTRLVPNINKVYQRKSKK